VSSTSAGSISANGLIEVFSSQADNLVSGLTISGRHAYVRNLATGVTTLPDINSAGTGAGDGNVEGSPCITPDGRYVVFESLAGDLTGNVGTPGSTQLYIRDLTLGQTVLVSESSDGTGVANQGVSVQAIDISETSGGQLVFAYPSSSTNLTNGDTSAHVQIFVTTLGLNASTGAIQYASLQTKFVSAGSNGNGANNDSSNPVLSQDGSTVIFTSTATNLTVPGGYNVTNPDAPNLYLYSLAGSTLKPLSAEPTTGTNATGNQASSIASDVGSTPPTVPEAVSANGQYVVFSSSSNNLVPGIPTFGANVFRRDLTINTTVLVSIDEAGTGGVGGGNIAREPVMTPDGRYIAFDSNSTQLTSNYGGGAVNLFVRDMQQGKTYLVSLGTDGNPANDNGVASPTIAETSGGELVIGYVSNATNLTSASGSTAAATSSTARSRLIWSASTAAGTVATPAPLAPS
jgi:hypothetical protein